MGDEEHFDDQIKEFFIHGGQGLNVTAPFKQRAFALASAHTGRCIRAGAANTLWMRNETLYADNTDGIGLIRDLHHYGRWTGKKNINSWGRRGNAWIIRPLFNLKPNSITISNRSTTKLQKLKQDFPLVECVALDNLSGTFDLVIQATSADISEQLPSSIISTKPLCYDLTYNLSAPTPFCAYAQSFGCQAIDGLGMLIEQAAEAFFVWHKIRLQPAT